MKVYFNNSCKICRAEINMYKKQNIENLNWIDITKNKNAELETKKTDKEILTLNENANVTPKSAECDKVSPKYAKRRQMTKHPNGPVTIATPMPATKALTKKSSNIIFLFFHRHHENDHDDVYIKRV